MCSGNFSCQGQVCLGFFCPKILIPELGKTLSSSYVPLTSSLHLVKNSVYVHQQPPNTDSTPEINCRPFICLEVTKEPEYESVVGTVLN